jgi:ornithine cyclodeaminase/alanine dehydrogenase-like protein (mu-crystallin family)
MKIISDWPGNIKKVLANHGSHTLLLDSETGYLKTVIDAPYLNKFRTVAAYADASFKLVP